MGMDEEFSEKGSIHYKDLHYWVHFEVYSYRLEVQVYAVDDWSKPVYYHHKDGCGLTKDFADAEVFTEGSVKWDGCSNWTFHQPNHMQHFCRREGLEEFGELLVRIWDLAASKVPNSVGKNNPTPNQLKSP